MISSEQKAILAKGLRNLALIQNADVTREVIASYVEILSEYSFEDSQRAIRWAVKSLDRFPKPVHLIEQINPTPKREDADAIAGRVIAAIKRFGWCNSREAKLYIGPEGWEAVSRTGGWTTLCESSSRELGTLRAQLRDQCFAVMNNEVILEREQLRHESRSVLDFDKYAKNVHECEKEKQRQLSEIKTLNFDQFTPKENL